MVTRNCEIRKKSFIFTSKAYTARFFYLILLQSLEKQSAFLNTQIVYLNFEVKFKRNFCINFNVGCLNFQKI